MVRWLIVVSCLVALAACQAPPSVLGAAPAFSVRGLEGGTVTLDSLKGKVVVLDFWATWCGPCIAELPQYAAFFKKNQLRGVEVVGVVVESGDPDDVQAFVQEHQIPYRQLLGDEGMQDAFGATQGLPTTFVIDQAGVIRTKMVGSPPDKFERLQKTVDAALAAVR